MSYFCQQCVLIIFFLCNFNTIFVSNFVDKLPSANPAICNHWKVLWQRLFVRTAEWTLCASFHKANSVYSHSAFTSEKSTENLLLSVFLSWLKCVKYQEYPFLREMCRTLPCTHAHTWPPPLSCTDCGEGGNGLESRHIWCWNWIWCCVCKGKSKVTEKQIIGLL